MRWLLLSLLALLAASCTDREGPSTANPTAKDPAAERAAVEKDLDVLAAGKDLSQAEAESAWHQAIQRLSRRGAGIEIQVVDRLRRDPDWGVRLGCIEVLQSIGSRGCIEHLIATLADPEPLVALRANDTLAAMTRHDEIPGPGMQAGANGLPPVPLPPADDLAMDAEYRQWSAWHRQHGAALKQAWAGWWEANQGKLSIE